MKIKIKDIKAGDLIDLRRAWYIILKVDPKPKPKTNYKYMFHVLDDRGDMKCISWIREEIEINENHH